MNHWIFIVTTHEDENLRSDEIFQQRMQDKFWGLGENTNNRKALQVGDPVVFYVGSPNKVFAGTAVIAKECFELSPGQRDLFSHGRPFFRAPFGVLLDEIEIWPQSKSVEALVPSLDFIENKTFWYSYFQGGIRQVEEHDFRRITERQALDAQPSIDPQSTQERVAEFALEAHLEEFIDKNWLSIDFGCSLERYTSEDQDGRQFPAGPWSIDFLCIDKSSRDLVVIEPKRGKTSDSTVGQILRYLSWVQENVAAEGQAVRGIIVAREMDEAMRYAVMRLSNVTVQTYRIDFKLIKADTRRS
jgi:EVE domain/Endonuclease NucS